MTELALPAGSLSSAITAFKNGADGVYFGLKEFSARKGAVNFSLSDLSRIRRFALENGKKIYVALNTLIDDDEIERVIPLLDALSFYGNDGVIVQDLGLVEIIRNYYPNLHLHGSTQLAVHTAEGVKELKNLGFERVVLSRELTLSEIEKIRNECRDIELKVFIHGALCYGFSGLCSASYLKCGRSANRGECAQICRSWFENDKTGEKGYYFSMEDLCIKEELRALRDMNIDSVKVEGRLKSPEYIAACARYYRAILDDREIKKKDEDALYTTFLRKSGSGYLHYKRNRVSLLSGGYPGHMGLKLGKVVEERGETAFLETKESLENHDGIQYFEKDAYSLLSAHKSSVNIKAKTPGGYLLKKERGERLLGKDIYKISDSTIREKTPSVNIPLYRKKEDISITVYDGKIEGSLLGKTLSYETDVAESDSKKDIVPLLEKTLSESASSPYTLGSLFYTNNSSYTHPFINPSSLKEFRRRLYSLFPEIELSSPTIEEPKEEKKGLTLPRRELLEGELLWSLEGKEIDGRTYFSLPPVTFNEEKLWKEIIEKTKGKKNVTIGLNNISHIRFASEHPEYDYFVDIFLYLSNRFAFSLLLKECPKIIGGYLWFERESISRPWPIEPSLPHCTPPYFISRTCFRHDALSLSCDGCKQKYDYSISQNGEKYTVLVRDCLTILKRKE